MVSALLGILSALSSVSLPNFVNSSYYLIITFSNAEFYYLSSSLSFNNYSAANAAIFSYC